MEARENPSNRPLLWRWIDRPFDGEGEEDAEVADLRIFLQTCLEATPEGQRWLAETGSAGSGPELQY